MSKKILVADDSLTIRKVVELTFLEAEYEVLTAANGEEAGDKLSDDLDVFIVDVHMPDRSGYELCEDAKAEHPELPVILLVGTFEQFNEERMKASGADGVLRKPFDSQELASLVNELTGGEPEAESEGDASSDNVVHPVFGAATAAATLDSQNDEESALEESEVEIEPESAATGDEELDESTRPGVLTGAMSRAEGAEDEPEEETAGEDVELSSSDGPDEAASIADDAAPTSSVGADEEASTQEAAQPNSEISEALGMSDSEVERIARRVVELLSDDIVRRVAWEVVPDLAEVIVKERIEELESELSDS